MGEQKQSQITILNNDLPQWPSITITNEKIWLSLHFSYVLTNQTQTQKTKIKIEDTLHEIEIKTNQPTLAQA